MRDKTIIINIFWYYDVVYICSLSWEGVTVCKLLKTHHIWKYY